VLLPLLESGGVHSVSPSGVLGDPAGASAAEGRALLREAAADLAGLIARIRSGTGPPVGAGSVEEEVEVHT
jgi:creatinine amidohydrolase